MCFPEAVASNSGSASAWKQEMAADVSPVISVLYNHWIQKHPYPYMQIVSMET